MLDKNLLNTVFMVMPFRDPVAEDVYRCSTKVVIKSCGMKVVRADEIFSANPVFDDIFALPARILIASDKWECWRKP